MIDVLKEIDYFKLLDEENLKELANISTEKKFYPGEIILYENDIPKYLYYLKKGSVKVLKQQKFPKLVHVATFDANIFLAEITIMEEIRYPATIEAIGQVETIEIDLDKFKKRFLNNPAILFSIAKSFSGKLMKLMHSFELETVANIELKIVKYILEHETILCNLKHKEIAHRLNTTPETLSRILKKLQKEEILESTNPIVIKDRCKLRGYCAS